jgi:hypothetical protein
MSTIEWIVDWYQFLVGLPTYLRKWVDGELGKSIQLPEDKTIKVGLLGKVDEILAILRSSRTGGSLEAVQNSSEFVAAGWPKGLVAVRDPTSQIRGMGFIVKLRGQHCLVTAAHVANYCTGGLVLSRKDLHMQVNDAKIVFQSKLDVVAFALPPNTMSILGVGPIKIGKTAAEGLPISCFGFVNGTLARAIGIMGKTGKNMYFQHTASTTLGFSGTPIIRDGVVSGIHVRSDAAGHNYALGLDFMVSALESKDYDGRRHRFEQDEFEDLDDSDVLAYQWEQEQAWKLRADGHFWAREQQDRPLFTGENLSGFSWADDVDFEYGIDDYGRGIEESCPGFLKTPAATTAGENNTSSGRNQDQIKTTCVESEGSISSTAEAKATPVSPPKKNKKKSKRSRNGNGQQVVQKPSGAPSAFIQEVSIPENGSPPKKEKNGSEPKSWIQVYTRELLSRSGSGSGLEVELAMIEASREASKVFPRDPTTRSRSKTSEKSEKLSSTTS